MLLLELCVRRAEVGLAGFWCAPVKPRLMSFIAPSFPQTYEFPELENSGSSVTLCLTGQVQRTNHDGLGCRCKCKVA